MAFPPWTHGCGQAAPGMHSAGRNLGNVDFGGGGGFRAVDGKGPPHAWLCGRKGRAALLAPSTHVPVCPVPPQISLFVGAWWQMGSYTTVDTPFPC